MTRPPLPHLDPALHRLLGDAPVREVLPGLYTTLPETAGAADYDRKAPVYDAIVGWPVYHRVVWGTSASAYTAFGRAALDAAGSDPFAEIGCGSLLFTAGMYGTAGAGPVVLSDRSLRMLGRAAKRLTRGPGDGRRPVMMLHADGAALPLVSHALSSVLLLNLLHVPCDRPGIVAECGRLLMPGRGRLFATCLVRSGRWGDAAMAFFHRTGELGVPLTRAQAAEMAAGAWGRVESFRLEGNMAFVVVRHAG
jgi:SAM-dependent methyltransferase